MSSDVAIHVEGLGKRYLISHEHGRRRTLVETLGDFLASPLRRLRDLGGRGTDQERFWALRDVDLEIRKGEIVGVIGRNGAGKSTLLKILSRITSPTEGRVVLRGRVGSLLEVGTGFHPELTGRENIFLNGALLGMHRREIRNKFDEIVEFAEVERFLDTPIKRYSSGMYVRLAFSVAAHLEPEILLIDEVLAVGDTAFQKKCIGRMSAVAESGRTVLFVSHNLATIQALTDRCLYLERGRLVRSGDTDEVLGDYLRDIEDLASRDLASREDRKGSKRLRFVRVSLYDDHGRAVPSATLGKPLRIALDYESPGTTRLRAVSFAIGIQGATDERVCTLSTTFTGQNVDDAPPRGRIICEIPRVTLQPGRYRLGVAAHVANELADWVEHATEFDVAEGDFFGTGRIPSRTQGAFVMDHGWALED